MKNGERQEEKVAWLKYKLLILTWMETVAVEKKKHDENNVY